ncbi:MAG: hypothetical protein PHE25_04815, partial [Candidatus Gracilibacteria bacterium]|nr:hypothetical protein [Candidatus Gracilibacteria bacterium]
ITETKVEEEKVPEWIKGALENEEAKPEEKSQNENIENTPIIIPEETFVEIPETKVEEEKVPDWLKGALGNEETKPEENSQNENIENAPKEKVKSSKKTKVTDDSILPEKKTKTPQTKTDKKKSDKSEELWNDGMDIPDWLKSGSEETPNDNSSSKPENKENDFWSLDDDKQN